jgi:ComF family protein
MQWLHGNKCLICKQTSHQGICQYCYDDLSLFDLDKFQHNLLLAPQIKKGLSKVDFPRVIALSDYQWPLSSLLSSLKFSARLPNAKALANVFAEHCLTANSPLPDLIVPMPLHQNRYLRRKFNQSIELAKHIATLSGVKMDTTILKRIKSTQAQTELSASQRRKNLRNAFELTSAGMQTLQTLRHVALFDDVITTGTTMNYAYHTLSKAFPKLRIDVWSICVTLMR